MSENNNKSKIIYLHIVIGFFLMFLFGRVIPPIYPLTEVGMQVAGVFVGVVWLWVTIGFLWPSLIALVAFGLTDFASFGQVVQMAFGSQVPMLLLFSMVLFGSPEHVGATSYITRWFLSRKIFNNRPIVFSFIFFVATYSISVAVNVTPALVLMWGVLYSVLKELNYKPGDKYSTLMIIGTFLGAISGQASLPFRGSTLAILSAFETSSGMPMPPLQYILLGFIMSVTVFVIYCLFMKFVFKPDTSKIAHVNAEMFNKNPLPPMTKLQKANFFGLLLFVFLVLLPSFLPADFIITELIEGLQPVGIAILLIGVMCMVKIEGQPILDFKAVAAKSVHWEVYLFVVAAMAITGALTNEATGILDMLVTVLGPILGGHSPIMLFIIMLLIAIFATSFASSLVIGVAFMPIIVVFGVEAGANLPAMAATTVLLLHYAIILPAASAFAAMLWGNEEWVTRKEVFKYGAYIVAFAVVVAIGIIMPLSLMLF